jgi:hypothetical protein
MVGRMMKFLLLLLVATKFYGCGKLNQIALNDFRGGTQEDDRAGQATIAIDQTATTSPYKVDGISLLINQLSLDGVTVEPGLLTSCVKVVFRLGSQSVVLSGMPTRQVTAAEITELSSIGIENVDPASSITNLISFDKNVSAVTALADNIEVKVYVSDNICLTSALGATGYILASGADIADGESVVLYPGGNYYLYHSWLDTNLNLIEKMPQENYRMLNIATTPVNHIDTVLFDLNEIQADHYVGYLLARDVTETIVYRMTNDGTGKMGWKNFSILTQIPISSHNQVMKQRGAADHPSFLGCLRNGNPNPVALVDSSFYVRYYDGAAYQTENWGDEIVAQTSSDYSIAKARCLNVFKTQETDPAYLFALRVNTAMDAFEATVLIHASYGGAGNFWDPSEWTFEVVGVDVVDHSWNFGYADNATLSNYTDKNNFTIHYKVNRNVAGPPVVRYTDIRRVSVTGGIYDDQIEGSVERPENGSGGSLTKNGDLFLVQHYKGIIEYNADTTDWRLIIGNTGTVNTATIFSR